MPLPGGDFGGQSLANVMAKRVEAVKDSDDAALLEKRGNGNVS